jgi:hypothetical protein
VKFIFCAMYRVTQKVFFMHVSDPTAWPPKSLDLTPLDFFAWGFIKDVVYSRKFRDLADLKQRIIEAVELIKVTC